MYIIQKLSKKYLNIKVKPILVANGMEGPLDMSGSARA